MSYLSNGDIRGIFQSMDAPFYKYDKNRVEPILWHAKNFPVQFKHEVKVPAIAGSLVKYEFFTKNGDISFGLHFHTSGTIVEVIREPSREPSDIEPIRGTYRAEYDGIFTFIFDNSYSWFTDKELTYSIQLLQPALAMADLHRSLQSRKLLTQLIEESNKAKSKLSSSREKYSLLQNEVQTIEQKLQFLQNELENKKNIVKVTKKEIDELNVKIKYEEEKKMGLCIRCLDKRALSTVLGFLGKKSPVYTVSKYWKACIDDLEEH